MTSMGRERNLVRTTESGIVAVIRASSGEQLVDVASALFAGGIDVMEITFTVPGAVKVLEKLADKLGDQILLGAGTVLDTETAPLRPVVFLPCPPW